MSKTNIKKGILLINLGSPQSPKTADIRSYLRAFLSDPRVMTMPTPIRWLILYGFILPFRPQQIQKKYESIWNQEGFPLITHSQKLVEKLSAKLPDKVSVKLAMRYGDPSIAEALEALRREGVAELLIFPLFPQYASATTGSILESVMRILTTWDVIPSLTIKRDFYDHPEFINAWSQRAKEFWGKKPDQVLFSFHGLPESHIEAADTEGNFCLKKANCCETITSCNAGCYRAQCYHSAKRVAESLGIPEDRYTISFQSRLGRAKWLGPSTSETVVELAKRGVERLLVFCLSFVADCLETTEEIQVEVRDLFLEHGGTELNLVPSLNSQQVWVDGLERMVQEQLSEN